MRSIANFALQACAAAVLTAFAAPSAQSMVHYALQTATVLCQKIVDGRYIHRRVQTPDGCFDEIIDTFNGQVVKRESAPCTPQC